MAAMRRHGSAVVVCFSFCAFALGLGCADFSPAPLPTGAECAGLTPEDAAACEGEVCLVLNPNQQGIAGICSETCNVEADCTGHEACVVLNGATFCLRACLTDDDCYDATVCRPLALGNPARFCLADPL